MALPTEVILLQRFGLGPRPGDLARLAGRVDGALAGEVVAGRPVPVPAELPDSAAVAEELREGLARWDEDRMRGRNPARRLFQREVRARGAAALAAGTGFAERLVWFWSNHFCVSVAKNRLVRTLAGAFEREAIRPHVFGRFADMLAAAETHPAMLIYLDNRMSIGPGSRAGIRTGRGLNENLAREILELHTLGVGGGYAQSDVAALAAVLTGWTVAGPKGGKGEPGSAIFDSARHEPGAKAVLGRTYPDDGPGQLGAVLRDLATHPSTALFVATKLARHFVADVPPPSLVDALARRFDETGGDLAAVSLALLDAPEARAPDRGKVRSPQEFLFASLRLLGDGAGDPGEIAGSLRALGQPMWEPPGPNGFPDLAGHWLSPEGIEARMETALALAGRTDGPEPADLLSEAFGGGASEATAKAVRRAESRGQAIALLLMSPEFQRR